MKNHLLLFGIVLIWINIIGNNWKTFTTNYDVKYWQKEFLHTQLVMGDKAPHYYSDTELYAMLGYKYFRGEDPTKIGPEAPPLGKWTIGASIVIFRNPNVVNLILGIFCLGIIFILSRYIFTTATPGLVAVLLISLDSEFRLLLLDSYIDIPQLFFLLLSLWFFLKAWKRPIWYIGAVIAVGLMMATKFYFNGLILVGVYFIYLFFRGNFRAFMTYLFCLPLSLLVYASTYYSAFFHGMTPIRFWHFQGWLTAWWAGNARVPWGGIFPIIFSGKWHTWWGSNQILQVPEWNILWPIITVAGFLGGFFIFKRRNFPALLLWLWGFIYLAFLTLTSPFSRYLVAIFPFYYVLAVFLYEKITAARS